MSLGRAGIYTKPLEFSGFNGIARAPLGYALQCLRLSYATKRPTRPTGDALSNHSSFSLILGRERVGCALSAPSSPSRLCPSAKEAKDAEDYRKMTRLSSKTARKPVNSASTLVNTCQHPLNRVNRTFYTRLTAPGLSRVLHPHNLHLASPQIRRPSRHNRAQASLSRSNPRRDTLQHAQPRQQLAINRVNLGEHCGGIREQRDQGKDIGRPPPP